MTVVRGALIGIANIIPGVSGGTLALVLGVYERLLAAVGALGPRTARAVLTAAVRPARPETRRSLRDELVRVDAPWLGLIAVGAVAAIGASSRLIAYLLDFHPAPTLAFFIGLIVPSVAVPYRLLERRGRREALSCLVGVAALVVLSSLPPGSSGTGSDLPTLFLAGAIAISAMILPGVSGSFVLMILGVYRAVLAAINDLDLLRLAVFAAGCVIGIIGFVRLLNILLRRVHSVTMAFLIGLILGSVWVLWPFKDIPEGAKIVQGVNVLPATFTAEVGWSIAALGAGLVCSAGVMWLGRRREPVAGETLSGRPGRNA